VLAQELQLEGWTIYTSAEEFKPEGWKVGDQIFYSGRGSAVFAAPERNQVKWKSVGRLSYPEGGSQQLFETMRAANQAALDDLKARIDLLRA